MSQYGPFFFAGQAAKVRNTCKQSSRRPSCPSGLFFLFIVLNTFRLCEYAYVQRARSRGNPTRRRHTPHTTPPPPPPPPPGSGRRVVAEGLSSQLVRPEWGLTGETRSRPGVTVAVGPRGSVPGPMMGDTPSGVVARRTWPSRVGHLRVS